MVNRIPKSIRPWVLLATAFLALAAAGCAPAARVAVKPGFAVSPELETVYVVPFTSTLVPAGISSAVFDDFVDLLNDGRSATPVQQFIIIKEELKDVDPAWLANQVYITGELWGYVENSGCCSTEMRVKARAYLYDRGAKIPSAEITAPLETFFDHDRASFAAVQQQLARQAARELSAGILGALHR
jgi:hypothetical protein